MVWQGYQAGDDDEVNGEAARGTDQPQHCPAGCQLEGNQVVELVGGQHGYKVIGERQHTPRGASSPLRPEVLHRHANACSMLMRCSSCAGVRAESA